MTRVVISLVALVFAATCLVSAAWVLLLGRDSGGCAVIRLRLVTVASPAQAAVVGVLLGAWLLALGACVEAVL